jgi:hypothetical protein
MDASKLWYPEILLTGPKHEFFFFYMPRVCEMLRNTSKHHFGSNGLEWMLHNFGSPKYCIRARNTSFSCFTCQGFAKCSETLPYTILGPMDLNGCITTLYPEIVRSGSNTSFASFTCPRLAKCHETLQNIILGPMDLNGCFTTLVPRNSAFRPKTQVLHLFTC